MAKNLPELQELVWSKNRLGSNKLGLKPFGSFRGLSKLRKLAVDLELITPTLDTPDDHPGDSAHLLEPQTYFPDSSELLNITDVDDYNLIFLCGHQSHAAQIVEQQAAGEFFSNFCRAPCLKDLELSLKMNFAKDEHISGFVGTKELKPLSIRAFLPMVIDALYSIGTEMRVWRHDGEFVGKLMYAPGFAAPMPHWGDVDKAFWMHKDWG
ncbi:hypothetical protein EK21DRAFT_89797 [Setomelanomma holmii]|uniref:Uncharacterized protein n=1 Tax=Setomelanomma holmii TaxID=210430 RepID=A0A9P4H810_9PLEO|nr:hypothetical protein EK21DRAFT_89797 [Setomelanomma holmii]